MKSTGTFIFGNGKGLETDANYAAVYSNTTNFFTTDKYKGEVKVTKLDLNKKIISGIFEFTAEDEKNPGKTIRVTDGWFDVKYR